MISPTFTVALQSHMKYQICNNIRIMPQRSIYALYIRCYSGYQCMHYIFGAVLDVCICIVYWLLYWDIYKCIVYQVLYGIPTCALYIGCYTRYALYTGCYTRYLYMHCISNAILIDLLCLQSSVFIETEIRLCNPSTIYVFLKCVFAESNRSDL